MARKQYDLLVGLFTLGAIIVLAYMAIQFGGGAAKYRDAIQVTGVFRQAGGLIEDAPVYLSGVEIGLVDKIEITGTGVVHVHMRVARLAGLRKNDVPEIAQRGVLGDVIVNFIRGENPGEVAPDDHVIVGKDAVDLMRKVQEVIDLITSEETISSVRGFLTNIEEITGEENQELLRSALHNVNELSGMLRDDVGNLRGLFTAEFRDDLRAIARNTRLASEDLPELTGGAALIMREARSHVIRFFESLTRNTQRIDDILASTDSILGAVATGKGTAGLLINDPALYETTVETIATIRDAVDAFRRYAPFGIGRKAQAAEEAARAEAERRAMIWRR